MPSAVILGGTGAIGLATAARLLASGWEVRLTGRDASRMPRQLVNAGARFVASDRFVRSEVDRALDGGSDLLVDCACFTAEHASWLLPHLTDSRASVMISSKAVYVDGEGNHANSDEPPRFPVPIGEEQPTLAPASVDYTSREGYGPNKVAAERTLLDSGSPVTVLRAAKVHGAGSRNPRERMVVQRIRDRRPAVFLADFGRGIESTSAAVNIASLIETVASRPGARVLNAADPDAVSVLQIVRAIATHMSYRWEEILLPPRPDSLGKTPWDAPFPVVLDMGRAAKLGYRPVGTYAETIGYEIDWLLEQAGRDGTGGAVDYSAEDRYLAERGRARDIR